MADDIQTERFGESVANESRNQNVLEALPVSNDSPYASAGTTPPASGESSKKGCGCWVFGCAGLMVGCLLLVAGLGFGGYWYLTKQVEKFTDAEPNQIPAVEMDEEALTRLQERIESFSKQVSPDSEEAQLEDDAGEPAVVLDDVAEPPLELVLTANEINALIHSNESLRGMAHVVIEDGHIQGKVSIPTDQVPGGKGRYFNADAEIEVSMHDGILVVKVVDAKVKGESLPEAVMGPLKEQNFAKEAYDDVNTAEILRRFESIEVIDDAIHLRLKRNDDVPAEETPISAESPVGSTEEAPAEAPLPFEPSL